MGNSNLVNSLVLSATAAILIWATATFKDIPQDVTTLKAQRADDNARLTRVEDKEDEVLRILHDQLGDK